MNEHDFIGEKHDRVKFFAALRVAIASAGGTVGPKDIPVRRPDATAPPSDPVHRSDGEQPKHRIGKLGGDELDEAIRDGGLRAYAELQLLAEQSRHMEAELKRAKARVERLDPTRKLVSQDLGAEAAAVAILMLQDLEGWARLFRVKGMELG
jgi:hypothetical protein